jgi:hypothetical protein
MDADANGSIDFSVRPLSNTVMSARATRLDFSVTLDGQSRTLPIFLHQAPAVAPTYAFSNNYETLTLFSNFPHGSSLERLNSSDIPELAEHASDVKTLVMKGDKNVIAATQVGGIKYKRYLSSVSGSVDVLPNLENVSLPEYNGSIPSYAFHGCAWLKSANIPGTISIGAFAFQNCSILEDAIFPNVTSTDGGMFQGCTSLRSASFPRLTNIAGWTFESCSNLTTIEFPEATSIGEYVFQGCRSLERVSFPKVTTVGRYAFQICWNLIEADFPKAWTFGTSAFGYVSSEFTLKIDSPDFPSETDEVTFGDFALLGSASTRTIYLGDGVRPARPEAGVKVWNGCYDVLGEWHDFEWKEIKPYQ